MIHKHQKRVLIALGWYDYRLHRGVEKFAQEHHWHLSSNFAREKVIPWGWDGDGILAWLGAGDDLAEFVKDTAKPTVDLSFRRPQLNFARVLEDHAHAAQLVAEHFLSRGFRHFMFYSDEDNWSYLERGEGFVAALRRAGHDCEWLRWNHAPEYSTGREQWTRKRSWLAARLKQAPKALAVFAANDQHAVEVLEACELARLAVPEQVAIVGTENYLLAPDAMRTPISSVDTNLETLGHTGAALLEDLMNGKRPSARIVRVPAVGVITRKSSDLLAVKHKGVANGLRFIWEHFHEPIRVKDLLNVAGMSRRGLHKAFMENIGRTPGQELQRLRMEKAKRLLADSDQKIEVLASMCGYQSANSFSVAFKNTTGMTLSHFRKSVVRTAAKDQ
ncbi:MAG: DNA-binding transcriptional regulator [Verrucomicrobiota bacterium]|jgi:LacI family transcriptional regulator